MRLLSLLLLSAACLPAADAISGVVRDTAGVFVPQASVQILDSHQNAVASATTGAKGDFEIPGVAPGDYVLLIRRSGLERRLPLHLTSAKEAIEVVLDAQPSPDSVTVTAVAGQIVDTAAAPQSVNVITRDDIALRVKSVTSQLAAEETGIDIQRTSPTMGGIFIRGLTATKVNVFIDGVRYSTSAMRGRRQYVLQPDRCQQRRFRGNAARPHSARTAATRLAAASSSFPNRLRHQRRHRFSRRLQQLRQQRRRGFRLQPLLFLFHRTLRPAGQSRRPPRQPPAHRRRPRFALGAHPFSRPALHRLLPGPHERYGLHPIRRHAAQHLARAGRFAAHRPLPAQPTRMAASAPTSCWAATATCIADLRNLMLDFAYLRYDAPPPRLAGPTVRTYSYNAQREERVNQGGNGNPRAVINHEPERTAVHGVQLNAAKQLVPRQLVAGRRRRFLPRAHRRPVVRLQPCHQPLRAAARPRPRWQHSTTTAVHLRAEHGQPRRRPRPPARQPALQRRCPTCRSRPIARWSTAQPLWPNDSLQRQQLLLPCRRQRGRAWFPLADQPEPRLPRAHVTDLGTLGLTGSRLRSCSTRCRRPRRHRRLHRRYRRRLHRRGRGAGEAGAQPDL